LNQNKLQKQIFCVIVLLVLTIGLVSNTQSVQMNSNFGKTISLNNAIARGGSTIFANGSLVYLIEDYYGFEIYNVSIKDEPEVVGSFNYSHDLTWDYSDMIVQNDFVYFFSQDINRITILDCSDVSNIIIKTTYTLPDAFYTKIAVRDWNILTLTSTNFSIYNFTNYSPISLLNSYTNTSSSFIDLTIQGNYSYILDSNYGLAIFNITDSANILKVNDLKINETGAFSDFYVTDDYVYIFEEHVGLHIYDFSDPLIPSFVTKFEITGYTIADILVEGNNAFLVHWNSFYILNVSNLLDIQLIGTYTTEYIAVFGSISVDGNFAYLTSTQSGELQGRRPLYIVDITNPESPVHVYPGDPFQFLSDIVKLFFIIVGSVLGVIIIILAIVIPIIVTRKKK